MSHTADLAQTRRRLEALADSGVDDPKLQELREVLLKHFKTFAEQGKTTRAMVFTSLKDGAESICSALNAMTGNLVIARHASPPRDTFTAAHHLCEQRT